MNEPMSEIAQRATWWKALREKDFATAQSLLDAGFDIEDLNSRTESAFLFFAGNGYPEQAQWLRDRGADPSATDMSGSTALHLIARRSRAEEIPVAIGWGVPIDAKDHRGSTALLLAATSEHHATPLVKAFVEGGANPNIASQSQTTPLLVVAGGKDMSLVDVLLEAGADHLVFGARGNFIHALLDSSAKDAEDKCIEILQRFPDIDVNQLSRAGSSALAFAVTRGQMKVAKALLELGADPNARSASKLGDRHSLLMLMATRPVDEETFALAFAKGADPEIRDEKGANALMYALFSGLSEDEGKKIEAMAEGAEKQGQKLTPKQVKEIIDETLWTRRQAAIDALIAGGASTTVPLNVEGSSAYQVAVGFEDKEKRIAAIDWFAQRGFALIPGRASSRFPVPKDTWVQDVGQIAMITHRDEDTIEALLRAGLDPARPSELDGTTLVHAIAKVELSAKEQAAIAMGQRQIFLHANNEEKSKQANEKLKAQVDELVDGLETWRRNMLSRLVEKTGTVDVVDSNGLSAFSYFVANNVNRLAEVALGMGADPLKCDNDGDHALSVAIKVGNVHWVHRLVSRLGPQSEAIAPLLLDMAYTSPEDGNSRRGFMAAIRSLSLVEGGVSHWLNARDEQGNTPLIVAAATSQEDLVDAFLAMGADPNAVGLDGNTALHHAITEGRGDIAGALVACGASMEARNQAGKTVRELATSYATPYTMKMLNEGSAEKPTFELAEEVKAAATEGWAKGQPPSPPRRPSP